MGTLDVENGGIVMNTDGWIGASAGAIGTVTINGASTWTLTGRLSIGGDAATATNGGMGTLGIQPDANVSIAQDIVLFPNGSVDFEGGTLSTAAVSFDVGGQFDWTGGTLHVGIFNGNLVNQGGTLAPGQSPGNTVIVGNYTQQAAASLQIEIGGTLVNTEHDFVNVTSNAVLGGKLELTLIDAFVPDPADTFTIFNADNLLGFFSNVTDAQRLTTTDGMGSFLVHYGATSSFNPGQIVLTSFQLTPLPGDYNGDGIVNAADYTVYRNHLRANFVLHGENPAAATPGIVDEEDYNFWKLHYGETLESSSSAASSRSPNQTIPEPATLVLLMFAAAAWSLQRDQNARKDQQLINA